AVKGIAIARQYIETEGLDLTCRPEFVDVGTDEGGQTTTAIKLVVLQLAFAPCELAHEFDFAGLCGGWWRPGVVDVGDDAVCCDIENREV
ncbi:hypothetical protein T492DRAFT_885066, partial [Pavlovales sp. CCMP2436]